MIVYVSIASSRLYLIFLGNMNRALAQICWMSQLHKCGRVQIDNHMKSQNFLLKLKKKTNLTKLELKQTEQ